MVEGAGERSRPRGVGGLLGRDSTGWKKAPYPSFYPDEKRLRIHDSTRGQIAGAIGTPG